MATADTRRPWTFAAVCVMIAALTLMVVGLSQIPLIPLLPWYAATYLLIGACIFGPTLNLPSLRQAAAFLLPGALLVPLALTNVGWWAGGWLLGLPAWSLLLTRWTPKSPISAVQVLKFLGLLLLGRPSSRSTASTRFRAWACFCFRRFP